MKKQYKLREIEQNNYILELYHNGELIKSYREEEGSLTKSLFDKLDSEGYTYGYTMEDLEKAWEQYSYVLNNLITNKKLYTQLTIRPDSSVDWEITEYPVHTGRHSQ